MDPISLVLTALTAGASASLQSTASEAIKDSYNGLKALIHHKFMGKSKAQAALADYEDDPETYEKPLRKMLVQEHIDQDQEIIDTAQKLMTYINPQQAATGKYNVQITGSVQSFNQGDHNTITQTFGDFSKES